MKHIINLFVLLAFTVGLQAQVNTFTGAVSNAWNESENWNLGHVPTMTEFVEIVNKECQIPPNSGAHYASGIKMTNSTFVINANSELNIVGDTIPSSDGIYLAGTSGLLNVFGTLNISNTQRNGIYNYHECNIYGTVNISGEGYYGFFNVSANAHSYIAPLATVTITGDNTSSGYRGLFNSLNGYIENHGSLHIADVKSVDMVNFYSKFDNYGMITIDGMDNGQVASFVDPGDFTHNHACGVIMVNGEQIEGSWVNDGYMYHDYDDITDLDSFVNNGFVQDVQGSFDAMDTALYNYGLLIQPWSDTLNVGQTAAPIFQGDGTGLSIVGNQFYLLEDLSAPVGLYDSVAMSWTPTIAADSSSQFYFLADNGSGCPQVMTFNTAIPIQNQSVTANPCEFTNGKSTEMELEGNGCVNGVVNVAEAFQLTPQTTPPADPAIGYLYLDGNTNRLRYWNGGTWITL